jgi:hypothetical protein
MLRYIICPVVAYIMAAPLTSLISLDLRETEWTNIVTYLWLIGAWIVWGLIALVAAALFLAWAEK